MAKYYPSKFVKNIGVRHGHECRFLGVSRSTFGSEPYLIKIGNHVTITGGVKFITHDGGVWIYRKEMKDIDVFGPIEIGNNVFVGLNCILMPGTVIGDNVVVGAGAVVTGILESNAVYVGVPAKKLMTIDDYKKKILIKAEFIRSSSPIFKKKYLEKKYLND